MKNVSRGSFLIEVIAVLLVLGIILFSTLSGTQTTKTLHKSLSIKKELLAIDAMLRKAHTRAISHGEKMTIQTLDNTISLHPQSSSGYSKKLKHIQFIKEASSLTFHPSGTATPTTLILKVEISQGEKTECSFTISLRSRIRTSCQI